MSGDEQKKSFQNAYVWLVMFGDRYVPGIITSVYSMIQTKPAADLVVMVTPDVSEKAIKQISKLAKVVKVGYITFKGLFNHEDPLKKYSSWIESSCTKWRCLDLRQYEKVFMLDADLIVTKNIDEVFSYSAPAGIFQQQKPLYGSVLSRYLDKRHNLPEKTVLLPSDIEKLLKTKNQLLASATGMLLEPIGDVELFIDEIASMKGKYPNTTGIDEQAIAYYMSIVLKKSWTVLDTKYNAVPWWKYKGTMGSIYGNVLHFMTKEKPWERDSSEFPELALWSKVQKQAYEYLADHRSE